MKETVSDWLESGLLSQREMAQRLDTAFLLIQKFFAKKTDARASTLLKLAHELGVNVTDLLDEDEETVKTEKAISECVLAKLRSQRPVPFLGSLEKASVVFFVKSVDFSASTESFYFERQRRLDPESVQRAIPEDLLEKVRKIFPNLDLKRAAVLPSRHCPSNCFDCNFFELFKPFLKKKVLVFSRRELREDSYKVRESFRRVVGGVSIFGQGLDFGLAVDLDRAPLSGLRSTSPFEVLSEVAPQELQKRIIQDSLNCPEIEKFKKKIGPCLCSENFFSLMIDPTKSEEIMAPIPFIAPDLRRKVVYLDLKTPLRRGTVRASLKSFPKLKDIDVDNYFDRLEKFMDRHEVLRPFLEKGMGYVSVAQCASRINAGGMKKALTYACAKRFLEPKLWLLRPERVLAQASTVKRSEVQNVLSLKYDEHEGIFYSEKFGFELILASRRSMFREELKKRDLRELLEKASSHEIQFLKMISSSSSLFQKKPKGRGKK